MRERRLKKITDDIPYTISLFSWLSLTFLKVLDVLTTYIGLKLGYVETNITLVRLFDYLGVWWGLLASLIMVSVFYLIVSSLMDGVLDNILVRYLWSMVQLGIVLLQFKVVLDNIILITWGV